MHLNASKCIYFNYIEAKLVTLLNCVKRFKEEENGYLGQTLGQVPLV